MVFEDEEGKDEEGEDEEAVLWDGGWTGAGAASPRRDRSREEVGISQPWHEEVQVEEEEWIWRW